MNILKIYKQGNEEYFSIDLILFSFLVIRLELDYKFIRGFKIGLYAVLNDKTAFEDVIYNSLELSLLNAKIGIFTVKEVK